PFAAELLTLPLHHTRIRVIRLVSPGRVVIALRLPGQETLFDVEDLAVTEEFLDVRRAEGARHHLLVPIHHRLGAPLAEIAQHLPGRLQPGGRGDGRIEHDAGAELLVFVPARRRVLAAPDRQHRPGDFRAGLLDLLARLDRVEPDEIRAAILHIGDAALQRLLESALLGADAVAARADREIRIELIARRHRRADLADRFIDRDQPPPRRGAGFLRRLLVLDLHRRDAGADDLLHRKMHVDRVAVAGIGVDEDRDVAMRRHVARVIDEIAQADDAVIGHAVEEMRELRAGQEEAFEAGLLRQERVERAEPAGHRRHLLAFEDGAEFPAVLADPIAPVLRHSLGLNDVKINRSIAWDLLSFLSTAGADRVALAKQRWHTPREAAPAVRIR